MSRKQHSGIFMMEMIMVVFFFILCASICILVFVKADRMSREAADLNQSVLIAQSVAEVWKAEGTEGLKQRLNARLSLPDDACKADGREAGRNRYVMEFDKNGNRADNTSNTGGDEKKNEKVYTAVLSADEAQGLAEVTVSREEDSVYTLSVSRHE